MLIIYYCMWSMFWTGSGNWGSNLGGGGGGVKKLRCLGAMFISFFIRDFISTLTSLPQSRPLEYLRDNIDRECLIKYCLISSKPIDIRVHIRPSYTA